MSGQKDIRTIKKGRFNKFENQGVNWYKMLENGQMTDFAEKNDQLYVKLSLHLNMIETEFFCRKRGSIRSRIQCTNGRQVPVYQNGKCIRRFRILFHV